MQIGALSRLSGVSKEALRFYESRGLITSTRKTNGYRVFQPEALLVVSFIQRAQQLGFTLAEVGDKLPQIWGSSSPKQALNQVLEEKLEHIDQRIMLLTELKNELKQQIGAPCPLQVAQQAQSELSHATKAAKQTNQQSAKW